MEPIIPLQTGSVAPDPKRRHRVVLIALAVIVGILYLLGNVWLYFRTTKNPQTNIRPSINQAVEPEVQSRPVPTPTPTPRPTGPGPYACAFEGACNIYSDEVRVQKCTVTYADSYCLDKCGDPAKRCKQ